MKKFVPRTCTCLIDGGCFSESTGELKDDKQYKADSLFSASTSEKDSSNDGQPLPFECLRETSAYVLLGAPGMGKTKLFEQEGSRPGCHYTTTQDFIDLDQDELGPDTTVFIDALDESRSKLSEIRRRLQALGNPKFRLSCREAVWFGTRDRDLFNKVSPGGQVSVYRLNPLTQKQVNELLIEDPKVDEPELFVDLVKKVDIAFLLYNPLTLKMLVEIVPQSTTDSLPRSRFKVYELMCLKLIDEHNDEHRILNRSQPLESESLLDAAGRLCAIHLLTGIRGYTLPGGDSTVGFIDLIRIGQASDCELFQRAVQSKLFHAPIQNHVVPIHRQISEFLAARYLSKQIKCQGLPLSRALALMTSYDSAIVSELRGLIAWLATHCVSRRKEIVERDPWATLLYGDVRCFNSNEKVLLLNSLYRNSKEYSQFQRKVRFEERLGELLTQDVATKIQKEFWQTLQVSENVEFVRFIIDVLRYGTPQAGMPEFLIDVLREPFLCPSLKLEAIDAFVHQCDDKCKGPKELKSLLDDIQIGRIPDPLSELTDRILSHIYPESLSACEVLRYFRLPQSETLFISYEYFWGGHVSEHSTADQLAILLDQIEDKNDELKNEALTSSLSQSERRRNFILRRLSRMWLSHFLEKSDGELDRLRLFEWLGFSSEADNLDYDTSLPDKYSRIIASFIEERFELHQWLLEQVLNHSVVIHESGEFQSFRECINTQLRRLFGARKPPNFGYWCVAKALEMSSEGAKIWLVHEAADWVQKCKGDLGRVSREFSEHLERNLELKKIFDQRLRRFKLQQQQIVEQTYQQRNNQLQKEWQKYLRSHEVALNENRVEKSLLSKLALIYLGGSLDVDGSDPISRVRNLVGDDTNLAEAVLNSLRGSIVRDDIPTADEVIELHAEQKQHYLALPVLAGLNEATSNNPEYVFGFGKRQLRLAIALHFTEPYWRTPKYVNRAATEKNQWFPVLLQSYPKLVAKVFYKYGRTQLLRKQAGISELYSLAHFDEYKEVARRTSLELLKAFPVRCRKEQLTDLRHLLCAAIQYCDVDKLVNLINEKLSRGSMNPEQRVTWLMAGLLTSPEKHVEKMRIFITGNKNSATRLERCFVSFFYGAPKLYNRLDVTAFQFMIRNAASVCEFSSGFFVEDATGQGLVSQSASASACIRELIELLSINPSADATVALQGLIDDEYLLASWRPLLCEALDRQKRARRENEFSHVSIEQVVETLGNGKPANSADLAALVEDKLRQIALEIRNGSSSGWRQYWNVDQHNRPEEPRPEPACRDTLVSTLKQDLRQLNIDVQPEAQYANDTRADVRVASYQNLNVPIELKRNLHPDVWCSIHKQLEAKYVRDPGAGGYGLYVVFWFGSKYLKKLPPGGGCTPQSAEEFENSLKKSMDLNMKQRILVCVMDVSKPVM